MVSMIHLRNLDDHLALLQYHACCATGLKFSVQLGSQCLQVLESEQEASMWEGMKLINYKVTGLQTRIQKFCTSGQKVG